MVVTAQRLLSPKRFLRCKVLCSKHFRCSLGLRERLVLEGDQPVKTTYPSFSYFALSPIIPYARGNGRSLRGLTQDHPYRLRIFAVETSP